MTLIETFKELIIEDTGWQDASTSNHQRGLHDYQRDVRFAGPPNKEELAAVAKWLSENKCPGWTGVHHRHLILEFGEAKGEPTYRFTTTMDSSD